MQHTNHDNVLQIQSGSTTTMGSNGDETAKGLVTLRPYELSDAEEFMEWAMDESVLSRSRIRRHFCASREAALDYLARHAIPHPWYRAVCAGRRAVGFVCFTPDTCRGTLSYALGSPWSGRGVMTVAVKMAVERVLEEFPEVGRVEAFVEEENKASRRVLEKAGFVMEGVLRKHFIIDGRVVDVVMYSRLSTDPVIS